MGETVRLDFGTQSSPGRHGPDSGPQHINAYVEQIAEGQPPLPIYVPSGLSLFATVTDGGECRGGVVIGSNLFTVSGTKLVRIDPVGGVTDIAGIPGSSDVFMARNAKSGTPQIAIVVDGNKYSLENNVLSEVSDTDLPPPNSVEFLDQRIIYTLADGRLFYSDIDDVTSIGGTSFATAEGAPDGLLRALRHKLMVALFGSETTELWASSSDANNPFQRLSGGFLQKGIASPHSAVSIGDFFYWIGDDNIPYRSGGTAMQSLAHPPVCRNIQDLGDKTSIVGFCYSDRGHEFWILTCPSWTWQLNITTLKWFERRSFRSSRWRAKYAFKLGGQTILGGVGSGKYYKLDPDIHTEDGESLIWTLRSPPQHAYPNRVAVDRLHIDLITGVGNSADTDPQAGLRWSDDGGKSWSRQILRSLGADGRHEERLVFDGLGVTGRHGRIWELQVSSPVVRGLRYAAIEGDMIGT